ncbi:MAG: biotin/lipoyl-containing protein [Rikenellaceae bacterium]
MKDYIITINGHKHEVQINKINEDSKSARVIVNGVEFEVGVEGMIRAPKKSKPQVASIPTIAASGDLVKPVIKQVAHSGAGSPIYCPLPGTVVDIKVKVGDAVSVGQTLLILEAMKMENNIDATIGGTIKEILVANGATVMEGETLIVIE